MAGKKSSKKGSSRDLYFNQYNYAAQKIKKLERVVKKNPNDRQAVEALKNAKAGKNTKKF